MVKMPHWPIPYGKKDINLGLSRVEELLKRLGSPHLKLPPVVHIAGTNGKGSTLAYLKAVLEETGYKVHRYISPHLVRFNERINVRGEEISDDFLYEVVEETRIAAEDLQVTFFEGTTVAAFLAFSKVPADIVLLETGMGGRLDATNVIPNPLATIITPVSFDHTEFLGDTLAKIAYEKAGIIKKNCPTVIAWQYEEARNVLIDKCFEMQSEAFVCGMDWNFKANQDSFSFIDGEEEYEFPLPALKGPHQIINASTAIAALQFLEGFDIKFKHIINGLKNVKWPARLQKIESGVLAKLLPQNWELWLDGAHNISGAEMLSYVIETWKDKPLFIINGRTIDRDIKSFLKYFTGKVVKLIGVEVKSEPKAEKKEKIVEAALELGFDSVAADSLKEALQICIDSGLNSGRILICGSLYLAGDVLAANKE